MRSKGRCIDMAFLNLLVGFIIAMNMNLIVYGKKSPNYLFRDRIQIPRQYNIMAKANITDLSFTVNITAFFHFTYQFQNIRFYVGKQTFTKYLLIKNKRQHHNIPFSIVYYSDMDVVTLYFSRVLRRGHYRLIMQTNGSLYNDAKGIYNPNYKEDDRKWFFIPVFQPVQICISIQCWNQLGIKSFFNISVNHPAKYNALSNTNSLKQVTEEDGTITTIFQRTPRISLHHVEIMLSNLAIHYYKGHKSTLYCKYRLLSDLIFAKDIAEKVLNALYQFTNQFLENGEITLVAIPYTGSLQSVPKWRFVIYNEEDIVYNEISDHPDRKIEVAIIVARNLIYHLFSTLISPFSNNDTWLNEALASFLQMYILEKVFPEWRMKDFFIVRNRPLAFPREIDFSRNTRNYIDFICDYADSSTRSYTDSICDSTYSKYFCGNTFSAMRTKGPFLLYSLYHLMTEEQFKIGLILYLRKYKYNWASTDDLWVSMQKFIHHDRLPNGTNLRDVMNKWLTCEDDFVIKEIQHSAVTEGILYESGFNEKDNCKLWIPIIFTAKPLRNFSTTLPITWVSRGAIFHISTIYQTYWIMWYYRLLYNNDNWQYFAANLRSHNDIKIIHVLSRAQIVDDAIYFFMKGELPRAIFVYFIRYLKYETDYIAWYPMKTILPYMWSIAQLPEGACMRLLLLDIWDGLLENVGYVESPNDDDITKAKRLFAIEWACKIGHRRCRQEALHILRMHIPIQKTLIFSAWMRIVHCAGMMSANQTMFTDTYIRYLNSLNDEAMEYLACIEDPFLINTYLGIIAGIKFLDESYISPNKMAHVEENHERLYRLVIEKHIGKDLVLENVLLHFMKLIPFGMHIRDALSEIIKNLHKDKQLEKVRKFAANNPDLISLEIVNVLIAQRRVQLETDRYGLERIFEPSKNPTCFS